MIATFLAAAFCVSQQPSADDFYTAYRAKIAGIRSATGTVTVDMGRPVPYSFGLQKPGKFFVWGEKQAFICNGEKVWQYMPERKEFNEPPFANYGKGPLLEPFRPFFDGPEAKPKNAEIKFADFEGKPSLLVIDKPVQGVSLTAVIDRGSSLPVAWVQNAGGKESISRFTDVKLDVEIEDSKFSLPAEAKPMGTPDFDKTLLPVGKVAPTFSLSTPNGGKIDLAKELKGGKALWLNFWFYGCGPCQEELPRLNALHRKLKGKGLRVLTVNQGDTPDLITSFLKEKSFGFPVAMNAKGGPDVAKLYGVQAYPTNYLISPEGKILARFVGFKEKELLQELEKAGLGG